MNRINELLVILSEECAEVQQAASKCIRFGMDSEYNGQTNRQRLESELGDFLAMFKLIVEETTISEENVMNAAEAKLVKVEKHMNNAKKTAPKRKSLKNK
jgi:NTP pyrophosphatase (non-canonical NTP hydrolase)